MSIPTNLSNPAELPPFGVFYGTKITPDFQHFNPQPSKYRSAIFDPRCSILPFSLRSLVFCHPIVLSSVSPKNPILGLHMTIRSIFDPQSQANILQFSTSDPPRLSHVCCRPTVFTSESKRTPQNNKTQTSAHCETRNPQKRIADRLCHNATTPQHHSTKSTKCTDTNESIPSSIHPFIPSSLHAFIPSSHQAAPSHQQHQQPKHEAKHQRRTKALIASRNACIIASSHCY